MPGGEKGTMRIRGLLVATFVLAALVGTLYWSNHHKPSATAEASVKAPPQILKVPQADINQIAIRPKDGDAIVLVKNDSNKWTITSPHQLGADQSAVENMLSSLASLRSERLVEDKAKDLGQYGLSNPAVTVDVTLKDKKSHKLLIGDETPTKIADYAKLGDDPRIFTIATYTKTNVDKSLNDLRDKRLVPVDADKITQISLTTRQQRMDFARDKSQWQIVKPRALRADSLQVGDLANSLTDTTMDLSSGNDEKKDAAAFGAGTVVATAKVTTPAGTDELQVRKNKSDYYAKSSAVPGIYKVAESVGQSLDKKLDDFRNKKLFDFGYNDPQRIEIHDGSQTYYMTKGGEDWWGGDGKKLDIGSAQEVVDEVRELEATRFATSGFSKPVVSISVTSKGAKQPEAVEISKHDKDYIARREGDPTLYVLNTDTVQHLEKSASELKPEKAPTAPAKK